MGRKPIPKYCLICGKELRSAKEPDYLGAGQFKYCGALCAKVADAKKRHPWAKNLTFEQLRHWYAT